MRRRCAESDSDGSNAIAHLRQQREGLENQPRRIEGIPQTETHHDICGQLGHVAGQRQPEAGVDQRIVEAGKHSP